jgi:hypothetical protein
MPGRVPAREAAAEGVPVPLLALVISVVSEALQVGREWPYADVGRRPGASSRRRLLLVLLVTSVLSSHSRF